MYAYSRYAPDKSTLERSISRASVYDKSAKGLNSLLSGVLLIWFSIFEVVNSTSPQELNKNPTSKTTEPKAVLFTTSGYIFLGSAPFAATGTN